MMYRFLTVLCVLFLGASALPAQQSVEKPLPLDGQIAPDGGSVTLNWFDTSLPRKGAVLVNRRHLGETGAGSWRTIRPARGTIMQYTDETTKPGIAYEYQVQRLGRDIIDVGYWATGVDLPAREFRGTAYVITDETIAEALGPRLARFARDLTGDGWRVVRQRAPRSDPRQAVEDLKKAAAIKVWLQSEFDRDPFGQHVVILVGNLPVVKSGRANPDGHEAVAHATDLFYGDLDGKWRISPEGKLLENSLPSDFIEMQVGRVDFASVSDGKRDRELHLLRSYFDKNHHWRMGLIGDLREAYGQSGHLEAELHGLRNIVGPGEVTPGGHHDVGEEKPWLWGADAGDWNGRRYAGEYANKAVFTINFGSGKQQFAAGFNGMSTLLAQPWYPIAVGWGGRPSWRLHHMALGATIGEVHMRTVNNGIAREPYRETMDYFPTGRYLWRNPVWVNLLGDPTTRAFVMAPPTRLRAEAAGQGVALSWEASADPDVQGYRVYRAANGEDFAPLAEGDLITGTGFTDGDPVENAVYMVRAYGTKRVYAGSFHTFSQGAFATVGRAPIRADGLAIGGAVDQPVTLPAAFSQSGNGRIHAVIEPPAKGDLSFDGKDWRFTPPPGFSGDVVLRIAVSDALATDEGRLTITIGD